VFWRTGAEWDDPNRIRNHRIRVRWPTTFRTTVKPGLPAALQLTGRHTRPSLTGSGHQFAVPFEPALEWRSWPFLH
jgi:hypothetical protein